MTTAGLPRISCLMVTADRRPLVRRSVLCFRKQTYPNRELVIVDDGRDDLSGLLTGLSAGDVRYVRLEKRPENSLGRLRNISLDHAGGDLLTAWDDDDWYHPRRLEIQAEALRGGWRSCVLSTVLMHLDTPGFRGRPFRGPFRDGAPGSLLFPRDPSVRYPESARGEDTAFLKSWKKKGAQTTLDGRLDYLQVRCYHGRNTWDEGHFRGRLRTTLPDFLLYGWYRYLRGDIFRHPRFRLSTKAREAFSMYLEDSRSVGLLPGSR